MKLSNTLRKVSSSIALLTSLLAVGNGHAALVAHYTMNNADVSGTTITDVQGGFNGTATNGVTTGVAGQFGEAAQFAGGANNGNNQYINISSSVASLTLSEGSIAAWIKPDTTGLTTDVLTIFSISNSGTGSSESRFFVSNGGATGVGTLAYGRRNTGTGNTFGSTSGGLLDGNWHHVALTVNNVNLTTLYIDGVAVGSATTQGFLDVPSANEVSIGRNLDSASGGGQWFYDGLMDDVRIYSNVLTGPEIAALAVPEPSAAVLL
jgi:hypothetical protein